jgi:hypothetical protein
MEEIIADYQLDPVACKLLAQLAITPQGVHDIVLTDGIIHKRGHIWMGFNPPMQKRITQALHSSATGGHSGFR